MPTKRLSQIISEMPFENKLIALGGLITALSVFLPWYQDIDAFKTGDMFLGITGPLYLIGVIMLLLGTGTVLTMISQKWKDKVARLGIELPMAHIMVAAFDLFLLVMTNSVYFHAKFGVNIMLKEFRFGMVAAFIGVGFMLIGGIFERRKGGVKWDTKAESKPLIDITETRQHASLNNNVTENIVEEERLVDLETVTKQSENVDQDSRYPNM
ncbi:MAG: hypothetical protein WCT36_02785 [Candidatus Gracilibacteria bacterium]